VKRIRDELTAGACSQVNTAISARQGIAGAQGDMKERQGGVRLCRGDQRWRCSYQPASSIDQLALGALMGGLRRS